MLGLALAPALAIVLVVIALGLGRQARPAAGSLALSFVLGALAALPVAGVIELHARTITGVYLGVYHVSLYRGFVFAALPEELSKFLLLWLVVRRCPGAREPIGGLVHGVTLALGLASVEATLALDATTWQGLATRAITTTPFHAALGALMGETLARSEADPHARARWLGRARALIVPILLHGMYDTPLLILHRLGKQASGLEPTLLLGYAYVLLITMVVHTLVRLVGLRRSGA